MVMKLVRMGFVSRITGRNIILKGIPYMQGDFYKNQSRVQSILKAEKKVAALYPAESKRECFYVNCGSMEGMRLEIRAYSFCKTYEFEDIRSLDTCQP